ITVLEESKETYTILSRNEEDVNILQNTAIDSGIDLSFYIENSFNFLEKINAITDSSSNPEQENTAENNNQSEQPESDEQDKSETTTAEENNSANVEEQQNYQIANGKVTGLETGKKGN